MSNENYLSASIKVIGVGGGGGNAVNQMSEQNLEDISFFAANTDAQALGSLSHMETIQLGVETTKGLGAGTNPEIGRLAALEDPELLKEILKETDILFLTAGMGGGTGTGAIPVIAEIAKDMGILTIAVVTTPFPFEGKKKAKVALEGILTLEKNIDSIITIPNEKLLPTLGPSVTIKDAFQAANNVLLDAVTGISELITSPGLINVDFADVKTIMSNMGTSIMGVGEASGDNRAIIATEEAISCPLLKDVNLQGAQGILVNITGGLDLKMGEFNEVGQAIHAFADEGALIKIGTSVDESLEGRIKVTVVATGMDKKKAAPVKSEAKPIEKKDYSEVKRPSFLSSAKDDLIQRKESSLKGKPFGAQPISEDEDLSYLDVPSFLRRRAD